jgi:hypothetical protein
MDKVNNLLNINNIDNIVTLWLQLFFNINIYNNNNNNYKKNNNNIIKYKIYSSNPIYYHNNDKVNIYIRIFLNNNNIYNINDNNKDNIYIIYKRYIINSICNNINIVNKLEIKEILENIYNKEVKIIPIFIKYSGINEFIIGRDKIYRSSLNKNILIKLNKYLILKSIILNNKYINKNKIYNIIYNNNILLYLRNIKYDKIIYKLNNNNIILPNINNKNIIGYNLIYKGKYPKADNSSRKIKSNKIIGSFNNTNTIKYNIKTVLSNGSSNTKILISQL